VGKEEDGEEEEGEEEEEEREKEEGRRRKFRHPYVCYRYLWLLDFTVKGTTVERPRSIERNK